MRSLSDTSAASSSDGMWFPDSITTASVAAAAASSAAASSIPPTPASARPFIFKTAAELCTGKWQVNQWAIPFDRNLESVDAVLLPYTLVQVTVSLHHDVKMHGLVTLIDAIVDRLCCDDNSKKKRAAEYAKFRLVFVVPEDKFAAFKAQRLMTTEGKAAVVFAKQVTHLTQAVVSIPLDAYALSHSKPSSPEKADAGDSAAAATGAAGTDVGSRGQRKRPSAAVDTSSDDAAAAAASAAPVEATSRSSRSGTSKGAKQVS